MNVLDAAAGPWVRSSYSGGNGGNCVEWQPRAAAVGVVPVRDSKCPHGPALMLSPSAWGAFVGGVVGDGSIGWPA
ncbi:DUF397 domain-containing protein [Mangrovactinospora gilvigrisea]|uniref:DUF397 domain-containing protein n=1 Tax=Mangrovactinospora gilvigrisea TaxID=1428644 RepID=A0A1J7C3K3_9ACTN|nr:DUF397 domain-containing protein [Mangrovactinospora gilvigrisea]OIV36140.1 DUF397 domain-containing protein [Mangrovactinospora gilvigrisea]